MENPTMMQEFTKMIDHLKEEGTKKDALVAKLLEEIKELRQQIEKLSSQLSSSEASAEENTIVEDASGESECSNLTSTKSSKSAPKTSTPKGDAYESDFEAPSTRKYRRRKRSSKSSDEDVAPQTPKKRAANQQPITNLQKTAPTKQPPVTQQTPKQVKVPSTTNQSAAANQGARTTQDNKTGQSSASNSLPPLMSIPVSQPPNYSSSRVPPVVIRDKTRYNAIVTQFNVQKINFTRAVTVPEGVRIHPETPQDFRNMTRFLEENRESFHTYQLPEDKLSHVVLRGVVETLTTDEIAEDLRAKGHSPHKVIRWHYKSGDPMPLVLVLVPKSDKSIWALTDVRHNKIRAEPQHSKSKSTQCFNCQLFGHSSHLCRAPPKCVKCGQGHLTSTCLKTREAPPKCANCDGEHTASYRGCPKHPSQRTSPTTAPQTTFSWGNRRQKAAPAPAPQAPNVTEALSSITSMNQAMQIFFKNIENFQKLSASFMPLFNSNAQI